MHRRTISPIAWKKWIQRECTRSGSGRTWRPSKELPRKSKAEASKFPKKKIEWRTFLERSAYDATQLRRMISAMLTSEEACGTSKTLVDLRPRFMRFFDIPTLPDPTELGYNVLEASGFKKKYNDSLCRYYLDVSEKHHGEIIAVHSYNPAGKNNCKIVAHPKVPEVHNMQFYNDNDLDEKCMKYAAAMFEDTWWQDSYEEEATLYKSEYIQNMRWYENSVWKPTMESDYWGAVSRMISWHTLESLVWELAQLDDPRIRFGEVYLYFNKSRIMAYKRQYPTSGKDTKKGAEPKKRRKPRR